MGNIIKFRRRHDWASPSSYGVRSGGWRRYTGLWIGAVGAGLLGSNGLSKWEGPGEASPQVAGAYDGAPSTVGQAEFHEASLREMSRAAAISFGSCHVGGGANCVVDGDTFWIGGEKVRIAGIDAPETHPSRCAEEARLGDAATRRLRQLLNSGSVTMTSIDRDRDRYGRLLRNVAVNGRDVGEVLIAEGLAREYAGGRRPWC